MPTGAKSRKSKVERTDQGMTDAKCYRVLDAADKRAKADAEKATQSREKLDGFVSKLKDCDAKLPGQAKFAKALKESKNCHLALQGHDALPYSSPRIHKNSVRLGEARPRQDHCRKKKNRTRARQIQTGHGLARCGSC